MINNMANGIKRKNTSMIAKYGTNGNIDPIIPIIRMIILLLSFNCIAIFQLILNCSSFWKFLLVDAEHHNELLPQAHLG